MNGASRKRDWRQPGKACPSPLNTIKIATMAKKIIKPQFRTPYSESVSNGTFERFIGASMTEPDNSMSIPEIIAKYTRGQGIQVRQHPWSVGEALEDGIQVGDGVDPEGFMTHGLETPTVPESPKPEDIPVPEIPPTPTPQESTPLEDSTK